MDFHFEGLDVPLTLPDQYLTVHMYENLQVFATSRPETAGQMRYVREALAAMLDDPTLIERTDGLPMSPHNKETWETLDAHLHNLIENASEVGEASPLAETSASS